MNYNHLNINERICIYKYKEMGMSIRKIAEAINRSPSTVSRELQRNSFKSGNVYQISKYFASTAQHKYEMRRLNSHRPLSLTKEQKDYIERKIELHWSPDQITHRNEIDKPSLPSTSTIYRLIDRKLIIHGHKEKLRRQGKFKRPAETRGKFNIGKTIRKRPKEVYNRYNFGHWEADTVVSGKADNYTLKSKYCFVTLAERKTRLYLCKWIPDRKEETVTKAIIELLEQFPKNAVKTITCDRGKEFAGWEKIEKALQTQMYFADPYCAWQKGTNENLNGLLREFFPKRMDLSKTNEKEVQESLELLNNRPRKCINYRTPQEYFNECLECCTWFDK